VSKGIKYCLSPFVGLLGGLAFSRIYKVTSAFQAAVCLAAKEECVYWAVSKSIHYMVFSCWIFFFSKFRISYIVVFCFLWCFY